MIYPLPNTLALQQCPGYISVPEYRHQEIEAGAFTIESLSPQTRVALMIGVGVIAVGLAAYLIAQRNKRK